MSLCFGVRMEVPAECTAEGALPASLFSNTAIKLPSHTGGHVPECGQFISEN
jgi:hypothetical protein